MINAVDRWGPGPFAEATCKRSRSANGLDSSSAHPRWKNENIYADSYSCVQQICFEVMDFTALRCHRFVLYRKNSRMVSFLPPMIILLNIKIDLLKNPTSKHRRRTRRKPERLREMKAVARNPIGRCAKIPASTTNAARSDCTSTDSHRSLVETNRNGRLQWKNSSTYHNPAHSENQQIYVELYLKVKYRWEEIDIYISQFHISIWSSLP